MKIKTVVSRLLTDISPTLNTKVLYYYKFGHRINLKNPQGFNEKLLWLKLNRYNSDPVVKQCADKYRVRDYIVEKTGGGTLNELYGVYDSPEEIDWDALPDSFVIKSNIGSGCNILVPNKSDLDISQAMETMRTWRHWNAGRAHAELQYEGVEPKILIERYLRGSNGEVPADYKLYCFNGKVRAVYYISGRYTDHMRYGFFDTDWNYLGTPIEGGGRYKLRGFDPDHIPLRPQSLEEMIRDAEALTQEFPFVRMDYYDVNGKAIFGEMTFTPMGGFDTQWVYLDGKDMGDYIQL